MLLCIPCKTVIDYGLDDILTSSELTFSIILVFDYDGRSLFDYKGEFKVIKSNKSFESLTNLIEALLFFSSDDSKYCLFDTDLNVTNINSKNSCKLRHSLFESKSGFSLFQVTQLARKLDLFDVSCIESLAFKKEVKKKCDIFDFIIKLPVSFELPKAGFLDKYINGSITEKYFDDSYFSKIHKVIDDFLVKNGSSIDEHKFLNDVSDFYKVNRANIVQNIDLGLSSNHLVPELVWLSVHFYYMAKLSYTKNDYSVAFANTLRCLEYYLDFIFLYLGKYYTKGEGKYKRLFIETFGESEKEANGLGRKFQFVQKIEEFTFRSTLIKPIEKLIKLRNSSFFGHGLLIPDKYYAQMAFNSVTNFILDIEKQARYRGASWDKSVKSLTDSMDDIIAIIELDCFIDLIPYASNDES